MSREKKKLFVINILVILLLGCLCLTWFRGDNLIGGGDLGLPLDRLKYFRLMLFSWDETYSMGAANPRQLASLIPYALSGAISQVFGFSLVLWEKILFYIWFAGAGLSMYYLCYILDMKRLGRLTASVFYMFNPFSLIIIWRVSHGLIQMPYAFAPLVFGLYLNGLKRKKGFKYIILACFVWLITTTSAYANPRSAIVHWLPIFLYFFWAFIFQKKARRFILKYTFFFLIFWLLFNFYWLLPFISGLKESITSAHSPFLMPDLEQLKLTSVKLFEAIRMLGYWSMKSGYKGDPYYPYWQYYQHPLINLISWLIPVLVGLGFWQLWKNKKDNKTLNWFILSLTVLGLVGISGAYPPFGKLIVLFYRLLPPLLLLARFNFLFFGMPTYLVFSILIGYGALTIYRLGFRKIGQQIWLVLAVLGVLLIVVLVFPFWNGEVIKSAGKINPGERFTVPDYWWQAKAWLADQKEFFRILPLPMSKTYNAAFYWQEGYSGGDLTRWLTNQPVLNVNTGDSFKIPMLIGESIEKKTNFKDIAKLLGFLNIKYLLQRNDTRWEFIKDQGWWFNHSPENIEEFIKNQGVLSLEKKIGKLDFYALKENYLLPHIYTPEKISLLTGELEGLIDTAQFLDPEEKEAFLVVDQNKNNYPFFENSWHNNFIWLKPQVPKKDGKNDYNQAVYSFEVEKKGTYEILIRNDNSLKFYHLPENKIQIQIDNENIQETEIKLLEDNLIFLGEHFFDQGSHIIIIFLPNKVNLVDNYSFETDSLGENWQLNKEFSSASSTAKSPLERSKDAFEGNFSLKITAENNNQIISYSLEDYKIDDSYHISCDTKYLKGLAPVLLIWENYDQSLFPSFKVLPKLFGLEKAPTKYSKIELPSSPLWQKYDYIFSPSLTAKTIGFSFLAETTSQALYDNVRMERVFTNPMILKQIKEKEAGLIKIPEINFKKISPVKYEVDVVNAEQPYFLVFSESYHPDWTTSVESEHLMINGFANGWYINKTGDYKVSLYFKPQKIYYFGVGVSFLTITASLGYLGLAFLKLKKKNEKNNLKTD